MIDTTENGLGKMESNERQPYVYCVSDGEYASEAVVTAVSAVTGTEPLSLTPLYGTVDPEALDRIVARGDADLVVSFRFAGHDVTVCADGTVRVY